MRTRVTKAKKYFRIGSHGLLYCKPTQSFTVPFITESEVNTFEVVKDIWPEPWVLPFSIKPLGDLSRQMPAEKARIRWPVVERRWPMTGGVSAAMNITGATVFSPVEITNEDWEMILDDFAT